MIEKRKFPRVKLSSRTVLSQNNVILHGRLENISKSGALVRLVPGTHVPNGSEYDVTIYLDGEEFPLQISAELVNINFNMLGLKFTAYDEVTETRLDSLLEILSLEIDIEKVERERHLRQLFENFRGG